MVGIGAMLTDVHTHNLIFFAGPEAHGHVNELKDDEGHVECPDKTSADAETQETNQIDYKNVLFWKYELQK